jgi:acetolactate synthase-1/2/3 large subunit
MALGTALTCPDRRAIAFQVYGSGLYTVRALWSMARENTVVTVVVCTNRRYRILWTELTRTGIEQPGSKALGLASLARR